MGVHPRTWTSVYECTVYGEVAGSGSTDSRTGLFGQGLAISVANEESYIRDALSFHRYMHDVGK